MKFIAKKKLNLTSVYGNFTFNEGDSTEFEPLVRQFPQYFVEKFEPTFEEKYEAVVQLAEIVEEETKKSKTKEKN